VDEVHHVKNARSKAAEACHQFTCLRRFGLTGTTIQNSYTEMWTILDWTNPGRLGEERHWNGYVAKPLTIGQSAGASEDQRTKALVRDLLRSVNIWADCHHKRQAVAVILRDKLLPQFFLRRHGFVFFLCHCTFDLLSKNEGYYQRPGASSALKSNSSTQSFFSSFLWKQTK